MFQVKQMRRAFLAAHRRMRELQMIAKGLASTGHPILAHVIPMRRCNLACAYCNEFDDFSKPVGVDAMYPRLDHLASLGTTVITISGGEPLLHPDLDLLIARVRRHGIIAGMITNGYLLTAERIQRPLADRESVPRSVNAAPDHRVDVHVKFGVLRQQQQFPVEHLQALLRNGVRQDIVDGDLQMLQAGAVEALDALRGKQVAVGDHARDDAVVAYAGDQQVEIASTSLQYARARVQRRMGITCGRMGWPVEANPLAIIWSSRIRRCASSA